MRVISGTARSIPLKTLNSNLTRPTTDRIKETLFNIINSDVINKNFLDLFCGSGAIGIEALSRGARSSYFIDSNPKLKSIIEFNLTKTKLIDKSKIIIGKLPDILDNLNNIYFDYIFMDPPYNKGLGIEVLYMIKNINIINSNSIIILEESIDFDENIIKSIGYDIIRIKEYKTNKHIFIRRLEGDFVND